MATENKYQKLYESLKEGVSALERQIADQNQQIALLQAEKNHWQMEKVMQQQIIQQALANSNSTNNSYLEEIGRLREQVKALQGK